jgi:hypothetical protein
MTEVGSLRPRAPKYRLYLDESGDHTFTCLEDSSRRHLALLGVWFELSDAYPRFAEGLEKLKRDFFGIRPDDPVTLHRSCILNRKGAFRVLKEESLREKFDEALVRLVDDASFTMVCVVLDKKRLQVQYNAPFHPYHYSIQARIERYCRWLVDRGAEGDVWAEARGAREDRDLLEEYRRLRASGTRYLKSSLAERALTNSSLSLRPKSANIAGLQLADILAHPVKQQALIDRGIIPPPTVDRFGNRLAKLAYRKFRRQGSRVDGYGRVWL